LFAAQYVIEDPVGWRPVVGDEPLHRFWRTFIERNDITFDVHADFHDGWDVVRDVTIRTTVPSGVTVHTPAHLRYELTAEDGALRIRRMAAYWEVLPALTQLLRPRAAYLRGLATSGRLLVSQQGIGGTLAYSAAVRSIGKRGKRAVADLVVAAARGDAEATDRLGGRPPTDLSKVIAAGNSVTATCVVDGAPAVLMAELDRRTATVVDCRIYTEAVPPA
jgi:hypothetical protein